MLEESEAASTSWIGFLGKDSQQQGWIGRTRLI